MRVAPLAAIVLFVVVVSSTIGVNFLWIISGISLTALGVLIFFMIKQDKFVGPRVLVDDARDRFERMGRDDHDEIVAVERRNERKDDDA